MATGSVGKLSIKVYPDTKPFKRDLRKALDRIERQVKGRVEIIPVIKRAAIADLRRDTKERLKNIKTYVDVEVSKESVKRVEHKLNSLDATATVNADLDRGKAAAQLKRLTRARIVTINARVSSASLATAKAALMALSGGNVLKRIGTGLKNLATNFDTIALKAASGGAALMSLSSVALAALGGIASFGNGLAATVPALLALPGIAGAGAVGIGVLITALKDAKDVLADLGPSLSELQRSISGAFWDQAAEPIREMINALLPAVSDELTSVASALGTMGAGIAGALGAHIGGFEQTFSYLAQSIQIASAGVADFTDGLLSLGEVGASFLPAMAEKFNEIAASFKEWAASGLADGSIANAITEAWQATKTLGDVFVQLGGIVGAVFTAIGNSGTGALTPTALILKSINHALSSPEAQRTLIGVFAAVREGVAALGPGLSDLISSLGAIAPALEPLLSLSGQSISVALSGIGQALESLASSGGLEQMFEGLLSAVNALAPAMPALGEALGAIAATAGDLLAALGPVIAQLVESLAPVLTDLSAQLAPIIEMLGAALVPIIESLVPPIAALLDALMPIITQLVEALLPVIVQLVDICAAILIPIIQVLTPLLQIIADAISAMLPALMPILDLLMQLVLTIMPNVVAGFQAIMPVVQTVFDWIVGVITAAMEVTQGTISIIMGLIRGDWSQAWEGFKQVVSGVWDYIRACVVGDVNLITSIVSAAWTLLSEITQRYWNSIKSFVSQAWSNITSAVSSGVSSMMSWVRSIPSRITGVFSGAGSWLLNAGRQIIDGLVNGIKGAFDKVKSTLSSLTSLLPDWKGPAPVDRVILKPAGRMVIGGFVDGMESQYSKVEHSLRAMTSSIPDRLDIDASTLKSRRGAGMVNNFEIINHDPEVAGRWVMRELDSLLGVV